MVKFINHFDEWFKRQHALMMQRNGHDINDPAVLKYCLDETLARQHYAKEAIPLTPASQCMIANKRAYNLHGRNSFVLSDKMCDMFEKTDLHNVESEHVRLPYPSFYISLPVGRYKIWGGEDTEWHDAWGIYLRKGCAWEDPKFLVLSVAGGPNEKSVSFGDDAMTWIGIDVEAIQRDQQTLEDQIIEKYAFKSSLRPWRDPNNVMSTKDENFAKFLDANQTDLLLKASRVAINLILYLSHEGNHQPCEVQERRLKKREWLLSDMDKMSPAKRLKATTKATLISSSRFHLIGDPHEKAEPAEVTKHWVRGHWQPYRVGKGRKSKVLKWKQPYQRGSKETTSNDSREYVFEEGDKQTQTKETRR